MEEAEIEKPRRKPLRKWLFALGVLFLLTALVFVGLALAPIRTADLEPDWLQKFPASVDNSSVTNMRTYSSRRGVVKGPDVLTGERVRTVALPFDQVVDKMNASLLAKDGWGFDRPGPGKSASWAKSSGEGVCNFWASGDKRSTQVTMGYFHTLSWGERTRLWMKRTFGL